MNIKRAKQEIKDSIEAYLTKDNYGEYKKNKKVINITYYKAY